ncbi:MAG TPA: thioredoxin domain-containing protein [Tissierellia bacterium]|nr:thioredoxin domain-containing protein [Tissierellia bacterium]
MNVNNNSTPNKLIHEKSPYLLQHAYNPVQWYPWGDEAFEKARKEDKPVFLSIGYSTCHWCHVMAEESFEDEEVAELLNKYFIPIKVDREERPDIDEVYMTFAQALTGSGGWPLNVFTTPDGKPFYTGTYFPKKSSYRYTGLIEILNKMDDLWRESKDELIEESNRILNAIENSYLTYSKGKVGKTELEEAIEELKNTFDRIYGGFGRSPKFPIPQNIFLLLDYGVRNNDNESIYIAKVTLDSMYKGGIFDHVGFGFCRYSVDEKWLVPHFEKMLYDNALLGIAYSKTYGITRELMYKEIAEKIYEFVFRDMTSENGGFYSALDADSEGVEGKFYVWDYNEIIDVLGEKDGEFISSFYDITKLGNFEGKNIPNLIGKDLYFIDEGTFERVEGIRQKLFNYREKRVHPHRDEKILTSWNGLMIASLAYSGRLLKKEEYINRAEKACNFILKNLSRKDGRLLSTYSKGEGYNLGLLPDYTFFTWGLIELYESTKNESYLEKALELNGDMLELFWDDKNGGLFLSGGDGEKLVIRPKSIYDGAIPSGNSIAALNMMKLFKITGNKSLKDRAEEILYVFGEEISKNPLSYAYILSLVLD